MANLNNIDLVALNGEASATPLDNFGTVGILITGTWVGTITFYGSLDAVNFVTILAQNLSTNTLSSTTLTNGQFIINTSGMKAIKAVMTSYTSGTASVVIQANAATSFNRSLSSISGGTDGTNIGNTSDKLRLITPGLVSTVNSTTSLLLSSGVFTGQWEDLKDYSNITVSVYADVASATDGLSFQWSHDGTNIDRLEASTVNAATGRAFSFATRARYFRVVYTNDGTNQATFRLGTVYRQNGFGHPSKSMDQSVTTENFALLVQSGLLGLLTGTNQFKDIGAELNLAGDYSLKVTNTTSNTGAGGSPLAYSKKLRYVDMNASNGGVARGTTITEAAGWVDVFSYSGSGLLTGFNMTMATANTGWLIRIVVDGTEELFSSNGILTTDVNGIYGLTVGTQNQTSQGLNMAVDASAYYYTAPAYYPINYSTSIAIKVKRNTGAGSKVFSGGLVGLTKES